MYYLNGQDNSLSLITTQPLKELTSRFRESYLTNSAEDRRAEMLQQANLLDERESFSSLRKQRFQNAYSFSIRTTFNQPGHLATVIAFDLPINDIIPFNMARSSFLLQPDDDDDLDDSGVASEAANAATASLSGSWLEFSAPLPNAPLNLLYRVSLFSLTIDMLRKQYVAVDDQRDVADAVAGRYLLYPSPVHSPPVKTWRRSWLANVR
ncbi:Sensor-like histidine kinase RcsD [Serratia odorifera]|uniref:Sensor-like histidine kinase RcsD n=1 Tax=Serratia odorifera TaxID=618 RepID=A0A3S5D7N7_SEROD|nr:Sensor-like histidine kinase RcsD [Serratia odorifera]